MDLQLAVPGTDLENSPGVHGLTSNSGYTLDLVFLSEQWQRHLMGELFIAPLSWSDHALVTLRFFFMLPYYAGR